MAQEKESYELMENNANAVQSLLKAVESTIGPKGLDTMLVDQFGEVIITNDGITILDMMEVKHPIVKMIINGVRSQQKEVGDGTTTTALMAGEMVLAGIEQIEKGVPVVQVISGLRKGVALACDMLQKEAFEMDEEKLKAIATIAAREYDDIAQLVVTAAHTIGTDTLKDKNYIFRDHMQGVVGGEGGVFNGVILSKNRLNRQMPQEIDGGIKILVLDDALEQENFDDEMLTTESGFQAYLQLKQDFRSNIEKMIQSGVNVVLVDRGVDDEAEELLADANVMVYARLPHKELEHAAEYLGAKMLKRSSLKRVTAEELERALGNADGIIDDEKLGQARIFGGKKSGATVIIGATTEEIVQERERIAKDAAASVQAAVQHGGVAGGGAAELAAAKVLEQERGAFSGMSAFGVDCVIRALRRPFMQIVKNAGFNPLEKLGDVNQSQEGGNHYLAIDCDSGKVVDMVMNGVVDPLWVKLHGLKTAGEVAESILRINIIVKKKEYQP